MVARPRIDTKPIARSLIQRFGSLAGVLTADPQALALHPNMGETSAAALKIVALAALKAPRDTPLTAASKRQTSLCAWS